MGTKIVRSLEAAARPKAGLLFMFVSFVLNVSACILHIFAGPFYGIAGCRYDGEEKGGEE